MTDSQKEDIPELIEVLKSFCSLQVALVGKLKLDYPIGVDWKDVIGLPKRGAVVVDGRHWNFHVHGTGVSFVEQSSGLHINCHCGLAAHADAFDPGRIVEFLYSRGISRVRIGGNEVTFNFENAWRVLADLCSENVVKRCDALSGWHYNLCLPRG